MKRALLLDRDGVINTEVNYLYRIEDAQFISGIFPAMRCASEAGYQIIIITNQAGIARGLYTEQDYFRLMDWMAEQFRANGVRLADHFFCPHHPEFSGDCDCRKPKPGMILQAAKRHDLDLSASILVGDKLSDLDAGRAAGVGRLILVRSGHATGEEQRPYPFEILNSLSDFVV